MNNEKSCLICNSNIDGVEFKNKIFCKKCITEIATNSGFLSPNKTNENNYYLAVKQQIIDSLRKEVELLKKNYNKSVFCEDSQSNLKFKEQSICGRCINELNCLNSSDINSINSNINDNIDELVDGFSSFIHEYKVEDIDNPSAENNSILGYEGTSESCEPTNNEVSTNTRNIKWDREEVILLLELYFELKNENYTSNHLGIFALNELLRTRAHFLGLIISDKFRNSTGIFMKLKNLQAIDNLGDSGLSNYSILDKAIWDEYHSNRNELNRDCLLIKKKYLNS